MRRWFALHLIGLSAGFGAYAGSITASVEGDQITKGEPFPIRIEIEGKEISNISVPEVVGATIDGRATYSGSEIRLENGVLTSKRSFVYVVTPDQGGDITIPPFKAEIDGEIVQSSPLHVTVANAPSTGDQIMFTQIKTSKLEAYQGEAITLTMEVWIIDIARARSDFSGFPELTGFYALPRDPAKGETRNETRDGRSYNVVPFVQLLFPTTTGNLRIGPWTWSCDVAIRGVARNRQTKTEPFTIKVKPLPTPPPGFSGSVGKYQAAAGLSAQSTDVGVPVTLTINITGDGNPDAIGAPHLPAIDGVYLDEPKRVDHPLQSVGPGGKDFIYKLTPQQAGKIAIPSIGYVYFDPAQATYLTAQTDPQILQVRGTAKHEEQVVVGAGGAQSSATDSDIADIVTKAGTLRSEGDRTLPTVLVYSVPVTVYAAFAVVLLRRRRFATDRAYARAYAALKTGAESLALARQSGRAADALYHTVATYIADQFNLPETGMTSSEAQLFFATRDIPPEIADGFYKILKACERARYAAAELSVDEIDALILGARAAMERLDEYLKRRRAA